MFKILKKLIKRNRLSIMPSLENSPLIGTYGNIEIYYSKDTKELCMNILDKNECITQTFSIIINSKKYQQALGINPPNFLLTRKKETEQINYSKFSILLINNEFFCDLFDVKNTQIVTRIPVNVNQITTTKKETLLSFSFKNPLYINDKNYVNAIINCDKAFEYLTLFATDFTYGIRFLINVDSNSSTSKDVENKISYTFCSPHGEKLDVWFYDPNHRIVFKTKDINQEVC